jgi:hypothetical protein
MKIEAKGKQVKNTARVEVPRLGRDARKLAQANLEAELAEMLPREVTGHGKARAFREMARRLRMEALLLEVAAAAEENRKSMLSAWARVLRKWRQEAELKKAAAKQEGAGSDTLH